MNASLRSIDITIKNKKRKAYHSSHSEPVTECLLCGRHWLGAGDPMLNKMDGLRHLFQSFCEPEVALKIVH